MYFEKQQKKSYRSDNIDSVVEPQKIPGFVICHNYDWDDCGYHNWYCLHYFDQDNNHSIIGEFHLMHKDGQSCDYIKEKEGFECLNEDFCSLGNDITYYESMYKTLGEDLSIEVLQALRDCAINVDIYNKFKDNTQFSASLTREFLPTEKALKLARYIIKGRTINDAYQFSFNFKPPYNKQSETNWNVNFKPSAPAFKRCAGIIGENGVGKTLLVSSFITSILMLL